MRKQPVLTLPKSHEIVRVDPLVDEAGLCWLMWFLGSFALSILSCPQPEPGSLSMVTNLASVFLPPVLGVKYIVPSWRRVMWSERDKLNRAIGILKTRVGEMLKPINLEEQFINDGITWSMKELAPHTSDHPIAIEQRKELERQRSAKAKNLELRREEKEYLTLVQGQLNMFSNALWAPENARSTTELREDIAKFLELAGHEYLKLSGKNEEDHPALTESPSVE